MDDTPELRDSAFTPGMGYSTAAVQPYTVAAGPEGCEVVEVRYEPISELTIRCIESDPATWERPAGNTSAAS
jgi:hypothetical protein